jgi:hypothetical protein
MRAGGAGPGFTELAHYDPSNSEPRADEAKSPSIGGRRNEDQTSHCFYLNLVFLRGIGRLSALTAGIE